MRTELECAMETPALTEAGTLGAALVGTAMLRPYVLAFLLTYLVVAARDLGWRRAAAWLGWGWLVAYSAEYASTRIGVPFGLYHYTGHTAGQEVFLSNVPLFTSLSFPFLAYAAWSLARAAGAPPRRLTTALATGVLMMLLDLVIDPLAVRGERWFLGDLFFYPEPGWYFGVPLANFAGWVLVGGAIAGGLVLTRFLGLERGGSAALGPPAAGAAFYYAILLFNLAITLAIGEGLLFAIGAGVHAALALVLLRARHRARASGRGVWARHLEPAVTPVAPEGSVQR
jgi:uncharacterized membrane protein